MVSLILCTMQNSARFTENETSNSNFVRCARCAVIRFKDFGDGMVWVRLRVMRSRLDGKKKKGYALTYFCLLDNLWNAIFETAPIGLETCLNLQLQLQSVFF